MSGYENSITKKNIDKLRPTVWTQEPWYGHGANKNGNED